MNVFNGDQFRSSAPTTYGFGPGHVFAIRDLDDLLYEYVSHDRHVLTAKPVSNPELPQVFTQEEFRALVDAGKVDPRIEQNSVSRQTLLARNPDIKSIRDLADAEQDELSFYWQLCRHVVQMYDDGATSLTDKALQKAIAKIMGKLVFGADSSEDEQPRRKPGKGKAAKEPGERKIKARKRVANYEIPAPSTLRKWIRVLVEHDWDILALRDHRKGRVGYHVPKVTDPHSVALMAKWVQQYLDRSRPSAATLYKLMTGSVRLEDENAVRERMGKHPLPHNETPSFAAANVARAAEGLPPLLLPSKSTFERAIRKLDKYQVVLARQGPEAARKQFKVSGRREVVLFPGERVSIDCWRVQLKTAKLPQEFWAGLPEKLIGVAGKVRLILCLAICEATKVVLGARLAVNAGGEVAMRTLEMVCRNKNAIALAASCRSSWDHACTPMTVPTDSGPEFIDSAFRCAVRDIGSANEIGPASHPDARGVGERFFKTVDVQLMPFFQGRTFSGIDDKGEIDAGAVTNVVAETLGKALVRYVVDAYHNTPHGGLGGQTPNDAWEERTALHQVLPPPPAHRLRTVFGFSDNRRIQNRGIRFLGLYYRSSELALLRRSVGQADVRIRADLENLGTVWFSKNVPGAKWESANCDLDMEGVSAALWIDTEAALRRKYANVAKLSEHIVYAALRDLRETGRHSAAAAGIGPSTMAREDILKHETEIVRHFGYVTAGERGHSFDGFDGIDAIDGDLAQDSEVPLESGEVASEESQRPVTRRRGRLGSDFLRKE
ncbi:Mu transposase C-terminal domain-containing protein [Allomesorhizobium camelthorni]|uniref:Transposase n=1 Tax=Allomesorhizobium camelthorni TaxID=475069 RepID=A0A6G4W8X7_9HYPH|nr:Mu transposase C-terminal domain-containing protein [Mesorhizobium camelthorni]NGO51059.1 transposase [Mesorhizobium camelthorni]